MSSGKYRALSPFEHGYLSGAPLFPPFAIQLWLEARSLPPRPALERALAAATAVNPGARLRALGRRWVDTGENPRVREVPANEVPSLVHPLFHEPFDLGAARPPIEVVRWEGAGLLLRCSHALMDARGLYFFAEELFRAMREEPLLGTNFHLAERDYLLGLRHPVRRPWPRDDRLSPLAGEGGQELTDRDPKKFLWARRSHRGDFPAAGARLAYALARLSFARGDDARLMVPVDLRQLDPGVRTTANFSNPLFFQLARGTSWQGFYRRALEALARHDERATEPLDALIPWLPRGLVGWVHESLHARQVRRGRYMLSGTASHVGHLSLSALSCPGFRPSTVSLLPFNAPSSALTLVTVQHDTGLEISASAPAGPGCEAALERALDDICAYLQSPLEEALEVEQEEDGQKRAHVAYAPFIGEQVPLPPEGSALALVVECAARFPARTAVYEGDRSLTYRELLSLAAGYERALRERGIRPGQRVALLGARSPELVAALLGVLAVGAAFVPLDPDWPAERLRFVLEDSGAVCLLAEEAFLGLHPKSMALRAVSFAGERPLSVPAAGPGAVAYVLYTSGSTGRPKGVMVAQGSLLNYVLWARGAYGASLVFPFFTSLAFDLTLTSLFVPLANGGTVGVFPHAEALAAAHSILRDSRVSAVKLTPSHLRLFRELGIGRSKIEVLVVGGEALPVALAAAVSAQRPVRIWNEYGPTEATVGCVAQLFEPADVTLGAGAVPIGRPIANTEVILLDQAAAPVAPGSLGELYLSGASLALGYLARPEEEARFSPHPFRPGERVYRTGDLGCLDSHGRLHYRGRLDEQGKVLGHRVEPGEVEAAIENTGLCREVAVVIEGGRVVAFVSWIAEGVSNADRLFSALAEVLPKALLPSRIEALPRMPLTINGKIDKSRLPILTWQSESEESPPADPLEASLEKLARALRSSGGREDRPLPLDRSLLSLGFDSLQMALLLTRASAAHLDSCSQERLFASIGPFLAEPSLRMLARHLRGLGAR